MTSRPFWRAEAATSAPIQPAPITTTCPPALEARAQRVGVGERAQVEHAVELGAGQREPPRLGAGRQQQPVVAQPLAVVEHDLVRRDVDRLDVGRTVRSSMSFSA